MTTTPERPAQEVLLSEPRPTFLLVLTYTAPLARIDELLEAHRSWLDQHYAAGRFLVSGPRVPRTGGVVLARARSRGEIEDLVRTDPFSLAGAATYDVIEFDPNRGPLEAALRDVPQPDRRGLPGEASA